MDTSKYCCSERGTDFWTCDKLAANWSHERQTPPVRTLLQCRRCLRSPPVRRFRCHTCAHLSTLSGPWKKKKKNHNHPSQQANRTTHSIIVFIGKLSSLRKEKKKPTRHLPLAVADHTWNLISISVQEAFFFCLVEFIFFGNVFFFFYSASSSPPTTTARTRRKQKTSC